MVSRMQMHQMLEDKHTQKTVFWEMSLTHDDLSNLCILISLLFLDYILINVKTFRQMTRFANFYGVIMVLSFIIS